MTAYEKSIARYIGTNDLSIIREVETRMVERWRILDSMTPEQFAANARRAAQGRHWDQ